LEKAQAKARSWKRRTISPKAWLFSARAARAAVALAIRTPISSTMAKSQPGAERLPILVRSLSQDRCSPRWQIARRDRASGPWESLPEDGHQDGVGQHEDAQDQGRGRLAGRREREGGDL